MRIPVWLIILILLAIGAVFFHYHREHPKPKPVLGFNYDSIYNENNRMQGVVDSLQSVINHRDTVIIEKIKYVKSRSESVLKLNNDSSLKLFNTWAVDSTGSDSLVSVPIGAIKIANSTYVMEKGQEEIIDTMNLQIRDLKLQKDTLQKQVNVFKQSLSTSQKVNEGLSVKNSNLSVNNEKLRTRHQRNLKVIGILSATVVVETFLLYLALK